MDEPQVTPDAGADGASPEPSAADSRSFDAGAQPSSPGATPGTPSAPPAGVAAGDNLPATSRSPVSLVPTPNVVKPAKRGGLAGIMDDLADSIAGTQGPGKVYKDAQGNEYIEHPGLSRKGQWLKIASEAVRGAAAGAAQMHGPGGAGRGFEAGVEAGDKMGSDQRQQDQQQSQEVRQANQETFNGVMRKHELAAKEFELKRLKINADENDTKFSQEQIDREEKLGSADLGVVHDEADLADKMSKQAGFWKNVHKNDIVAIPELGPNGERMGLHVFQRTPGIGNQPVDPGTPIRIFTPGKTPQDPPTITNQVPTVPMTHNQVDAYNATADNKIRQWKIDNSEEGLKAAQATEANQSAASKKAETPGIIAKNAAEAASATASAGKKENGKTGYVEKPDGTVWIADEGAAKEAGLPFEEMKPGDINKDKQALRQLNDVQLNTSRYTKAAHAYADPNAVLTYHGKPVSAANPVHPDGPLSLVGIQSSIVDTAGLRDSDNRNLNDLMTKAGVADIEASISAGGHITVPVISQFGEKLSKMQKSRAYNELSDQGKDLYDGYVRTMASIPAYQKALTGIGRSNKEMLDLELANIAHPGMAAGDIVRKQAQFQENIDRAADGFPRNMVGVRHPSQTRREVEGPPPVNPANIPGIEGMPPSRNIAPPAVRRPNPPVNYVSPSSGEEQR